MLKQTLDHLENREHQGREDEQLIDDPCEIVIIIIMQQKSDEYRTMYIKFPTVTKLQYPIELITDKSATMRNTQALTFRQNYMRKTQIKLDIIRAADSFKIIQLPEKEEIMNICTMTVQNKERTLSPGHSDGHENFLRKKIFSVSKLNTLSIKPDNESSGFKNPFKMRSSSIKDLGKLSLPPAISFDYFEVYPQIARLISLSFGVVIVNEGAHKLRKGKVDFSNNGLLIKQTMKKRAWWIAATDEQTKQFRKEEGEPKVNFIWTPQILPKRQLERAIENNDSCIRPANEQDEHKLFFQRSFDKILNQLTKIKQLFFTEWEQQPTKLKDWLNKLQKEQQLFMMYPDELVINNHLSNHTQITNKKLLYKNMVNYYNLVNINPDTRLPKTHHVTCFNWQDIIKELKSQEKIWILKPGEFTNRGNGISIYRNTKQALDEILINPPRSQEKSLLLQEYISPLLYEERKFDIRCYMLGVEVGKCLKFFWYEEGYIRTASEKFSTRKVSKSIHLTNDAVQKHMPNYDKYEPANKLSYSELDKYCLNHNTFSFYQNILPEMKKITRDICHAVGDQRLIGSQKGVSFQVYGLDFLIDESGKPWLCEVNTNPSLEICSSLLSRIIPELIQNTFRLVIDIFLPPSKKTPEYAQSFLTNNRYSLIYSNCGKSG